MRSGHRRSAMRVRDGRVQKKNNWAVDRGDYRSWTQAEIRIDRGDPGYGSRHLITVAQLREFLELLPDWDELTIGLDAIVLDSEQDAMGWCGPGVVAVCAWEADLWWDYADRSWVDEHRGVLDSLEVDCERRDDRRYDVVRWTEDQARAFQLLHVLPHELGHHHDRMTNRSKLHIARGEPFAEDYAIRVMNNVLPVYATRFDL
jgi:hypothetical protein